MMTEESLPESVDTPNTVAQEHMGQSPDKEHHEHIYDLLTRPGEITWRSIILELIKSEQMDPWDINISQLSKKYIKALKKLKEMNLQLSGKILLAAALLLRIKSSRLVGDDLMEFDRLLASGENSDDLYSDDDFVEGEFGKMGVTIAGQDMDLIPKTPQPRKRKVSVYDLIDALAIALNVRRRRILNNIDVKDMKLPEKTMDISVLMNDLYDDFIGYLTRDDSGKVSFSELVPGDSKQDKIHTFVPLLHLTNARKIDLDQQNHFGEIWVKLAKKNEKTVEATKSEDDVE